ncbi:MAG: type IV toxin-antitoxin system AbiEi family antitoxin domain-containing protein [Dehalococcoidia bacterium]
MGDTMASPQSRPPASLRPDRGRLFEIASEQAGYFSTRQAGASGFSRSLLSHHVKSGRFTRVRRGLYRLREYPSSPREHVLAAWLAIGKDSAVVSHESALELLELSDVIPDAVHLTVPRSRRNLPSLNGVRVHTTSRPLRRTDRVTRGGIVVTAATRSILDAADAGMAPEQIEQAVVQAIDAGLATTQQLRQGAQERGRRTAKLIERSLGQAKR